MSDRHDFQHWGNFGRIVPGTACVAASFVLSDRGRRFERLGPDTPEARMSFVSLARDAGTGTLYAGTQGAGVAVMEPSGANWRWMNDGFLDPAPIIAQLEVDPPAATSTPCSAATRPRPPRPGRARASIGCRAAATAGCRCAARRPSRRAARMRPG